jgi:hypothetical protein
MKVRPVGAKLLHADRQTNGRTDGHTDMTKLIIAFAIMRTRLNTMLCLEVVAVRSDIHTKSRNIVCGQNVKHLGVKPSGIHSNHDALNGRTCNFNIYSNRIVIYPKICSS